MYDGLASATMTSTLAQAAPAEKRERSGTYSCSAYGSMARRAVRPTNDKHAWFLPIRRDVRHTFAKLALAATADAVAVQAALGHMDLRTTRLYQSSTPARTAAASAAVEQAFMPASDHGRGSWWKQRRRESPAFQARARSALGQSIGLLRRGQQVRILPGAPTISTGQLSPPRAARLGPGAT